MTSDAFLAYAAMAFTFIGIVTLTLAGIAAYSWVIMTAWNYLAASTMHITFTQAVAVSVLSTLIKSVNINWEKKSA